MGTDYFPRAELVLGFSFSQSTLLESHNSPARQVPLLPPAYRWGNPERLSDPVDVMLLESVTRRATASKRFKTKPRKTKSHMLGEETRS